MLLSRTLRSSFPRGFRPTQEISVRLIADAIMMLVAVAAGLLLWLLWLDVNDKVDLNWPTLFGYFDSLLVSAILLLPLNLTILAWSGVYTRGRSYSSHYKAVVIFVAITPIYLVFGCLALFLQRLIPVPVPAICLAWIFSLASLVTARVWSLLWGNVDRLEDYLYRRDTTNSRIRNVLVIGGAGYIGSALLPKLLAAGYNVRLLDLLLFGTRPIARFLEHPRLEIVQADFREVDKVVDAMRGIDAVIHLGAIVGDPACAVDEELTIEVNLEATRMIAEVAKGSGVSRFIFASTCSVYGVSDQQLTEQSVLNPVSLYARSKIASERVLMRMADGYFSPVILRFGTIYGLSGRTRFDLVVNLLAAKAIVEGQITIQGGDQWRPFVHVDDAALAIFRALHSPAPLVDRQVFNVGSDEQNYTIGQVGEIIHELVPAASLVHLATDGDRRNYRVNFEKIRNTLDFNPRWSLQQGIRQVIEAINSGAVYDYRAAEYSNVKFLSEARSSSIIRPQNGWAYALLDQAAGSMDSMGARKTA